MSQPREIPISSAENRRADLALIRERLRDIARKLASQDPETEASIADIFTVIDDVITLDDRRLTDLESGLAGLETWVNDIQRRLDGPGF